MDAGGRAMQGAIAENTERFKKIMVDTSHKVVSHKIS
jgi:hypothetical protein